MPVPYPLIRALLPLCLGIWAGDCYPLSGPHALLWGGVVALLVLSAVAYLIERYRIRYTSTCATPHSDIVLFPLLLFLTGAALATFHRPGTPILPNDGSHAESVYLFELISTPKERQHTYVCRARAIAQKKETDTVSIRIQPDTYLLYVNKEGFNPADWIVGKRVAARTSLRAFTPLPDNATFDYPTYARRRGWSGTAYLAQGSWSLSQPVKSSKAVSWMAQIKEGITSCRQRLITFFRSSNLEEEPLGLITALTIGDKELLPAETKATFARTGVSHLLALSGLHVGILYTLLLLPTLPLRKRFIWIRSLCLILILTVLWGFALLTGLSASVVRSVTMYSLLTIGLLAGSPVISLNKLASAALLLLIMRPYWLFDVGFQLSCTGVASILYFGPMLRSHYTPRSRWKRFLWNFFIISFTAQLGTAPLVASYFGTFSPYFLIANGWSIPLVTLLLYVSMAWITCYGISILCSLPSIPLAGDLFPSLFSNLTHLLSNGLHFIQQLPYSSISVPRPDVFECLITYTILLFIPLRKGRNHYSVTILILLLVWLMAFYHYFLR